MEDDGGPVLCEHLAHPLLLLAVGEHRDRGAHVAVLLELAQDLEQVVLGVVDEHQSPGIHAGDLATQLAADRSSGAGDHDHLVGQVRADALELHADRFAPEHVLDADLAQLPGDLQLTRSVGQQLEHGRHRADRDAALAACGHDACAQRAGRRWDRDHDLVGLDLVEDPREIVCGGGAEHLEAVLVLDPLLAGVVVDEPDRPHPQLRVARELTHDQATAVATADDQRVASPLLHAEAAGPPLDDEVHEEARAEQQHEHQQEEHRDHAGGQRHRARQAARGRLHRVQQRDSAGDDGGRDDYGLDHRLVVALAHERPQALVEPEQREHDHRHGHDPPHGGVEQVRRNGSVRHPQT